MATGLIFPGHDTSMRLQNKFVIYNALSKALIVGAFALLLPLIAEKIAYRHIDNRLEARKDLLIRKIQLGGLDQALLEEDCSFDDYNIFKEEFISIQPLSNEINHESDSVQINNEIWSIDDGNQQEHRVIRQSFLYDNQWYELNIGEGVTAINQLKKTITGFSVWSMAIIVFISVFLDLGFARFVLRPFYRIVDRKLRNTNNPLNFEFDQVKTGTYEFAYLDESINSLMKKIQEAFNIEREFISNVSHELLTPLSILKTRFENLVTDPATPQATAIKIMESEKTVNRLSKIIKALLMISRIENEQYLKNENADLSSIVEEVVEELEARIEAKPVKIIKNLESFEYLSCNKSLIFTMIFNIVNNAIKYNKQSGIIEITGRRSGNEYFLSVNDTGRGMNKEQVDLIFGRFKKLNKDDDNSFGLGLAIVKTIAAFHQITIKVESEIEKGTSFSLIFSNKK
ncbi:MAG: HAMP domain-containing histidine kinase [Bacteroidia bacterium]|nr:HAMP domain-containing histidine kinase [Bacteroidia bacterium]